MPQIKEFDIAIVGGGFVGTALTIALQHLPLKIALIEAQPAQTQLAENFDTRSIGLSLASVNILSALDVWSAVANHAALIDAVHVSEKGRFGMTRFSAIEAKVPHLGAVVKAPALKKALYEKSRACSNVDYFCPEKLIALQQSEAGSILQLNQNKLFAKMVVAADGANSTLRQLLKVGVRQHDYQQVAIVANVGLEKPHNHTAYERFTETGPIALLPHQGNQCGLVWAQSPERAETLMALSEADFLHELQRAFGRRLGAFVQLGQRQKFPLKLVMSHEVVRDHFVMIGNAAHSVHPITAQGLNLGLRDVATLAELINDEWDKCPVPALLKTYQQVRQWDQGRIVQFTDKVSRVFTNSYQPLAWLRNAGLVTIDNLPRVKHLFAKYSMGMGGWLPRLACGQRLSS